MVGQRLRRTSEFDGLDRRAVTGADLVAHSVAVVCPAGSALGLAFVLPTIVGPGAWLSVLIGFGVAYLLASAFGQFGSRVTAAGSLYTYAAKGVGACAALMVCLSLLLGYLVLVSFGLAAAGRRVDVGMTTLTGQTMPGWLDVAAVGVLALLCLWVIGRGIRWSTRFAFIAEALALACLGMVLVATAVVHGLPTAAHLSLAGAEPGRILAGAALIMTITVGFESAAALGVEAARPFRTVPGSLRATVLLTGAVFLLSVVINSGPAGARGATSGHWFRPGTVHSPVDGLVMLTMVLPFATLALCACTALTRLVFSLAREGLLPARLGTADPRTRTPRAATLVVLPLAFTPIAVTVATGHPVGWAAGHLLNTSTVILCVAYAITAVAVVPFLSSIDELNARAVVVALAAAAGVALLTAVVVAEDSMTGRYGVLGTLSTVVLAGLAWWAWLRSRQPRVLARVGTHEVPLTSEVLLNPITMGRARG